VPARPRRLATAISILACTAAPAILGAAPAAAHGGAQRGDCAKPGAHGPGGASHICRPHTNKLKPSKQKTAKLHAAQRQHAAKARPVKTKTKSQPVPVTPEAPAEPLAAATQQAAVEHTAATIAAVLATPCQNAELTPEAGNIALVRAAVLCLINRKRAENNESPLIANANLEQAAESHAQELIADDYFAHVSPSGETPVDRIRDTGYIPSPSDGYVIGENLAWGTYQLSTPQAIVAAWIASPGHLANILEAQYRETGIAVTPAVPASLAPGSPGATYAQEFGVIIP
jgi:uncharacterized protein YkwD